MRILVAAILGISSLGVSCTKPAQNSEIASVVEGDHIYFANLHFTGTVAGRAVKSVKAHTGVQSKFPDFTGRQPEWRGIRDEEMQSEGGVFTAKVRLNGRSSSGSFSITATPVVQYFVSFVDGGSQITDVSELKVSEDIVADYGNEVIKLKSRMEALSKEDAIPTESVVVLEATTWRGDRSEIDKLIESAGMNKIYK